MSAVKRESRDAKRNQKWLAKRLKCTQQRISKLLRREGWRWPKSGWTDAELVEIKTWRDGLREENPATSSGAPDQPPAPDASDPFGIADITDPAALLRLVQKPSDRIKLGAVIERAAKVKVDRELLLGGYLKKEEVEAGRVQRVQAVMAFFASIRSLAPVLVGMTEPEIERKLEGWAREGCQRFEQGGA